MNRDMAHCAYFFGPVRTKSVMPQLSASVGKMSTGMPDSICRTNLFVGPRAPLLPK